jgi:predicted CXXCH cytochrome family protein
MAKKEKKRKCKNHGSATKQNMLKANAPVICLACGEEVK